ncbi:MAG: YdcF family protein [Phenylobacterium sp.]|nr:MAG: YdcF family protein [Phenylobacterium sp.]
MRSIAAFLILVLIWTSGLLAFADRVERSTPAAAPQPADGIVVLTGVSARERIGAGIDLLAANDARRLLVSGVNRDLTREDVRNVSNAVKRLYDCCVDLGFSALNTVGNARETADWAKAMRFSSLIVVTADYHMPRAMLELGAATRRQGVQLQPYPVATTALNARRWWRSPGATRLLVVEYCKYLAILGRELILSLGPRDHGHGPAPQKG